MEILVFRSIRPEEMGYVISDINELYENKVITVITNKQNFFAMQNTRYVNKVITYSGNNFEYYSYLKDEVERITKHKYDLVIIPTNGNIETYKNIYKFVKRYFNSNSVKYYVYPKKILDHPNVNSKKILKSCLQIAIDIFALPFVIVILVLFYISSIFKK